MYSRIVLTAIFWHYRMPFDANSCVSTLINVTLLAKILIKRDNSVNDCRFNQMNVFLRF